MAILAFWTYLVLLPIRPAAPEFMFRSKMATRRARRGPLQSPRDPRSWLEAVIVRRSKQRSGTSRRRSRSSKVGAS